MSSPTFIRLSGWALVLGAIPVLLFAFVSVFGAGSWQPSWFGPAVVISYLGVPFASPILLAIGLLGLRSRYGERAGLFGKTVLLFGALYAPLGVALLISSLLGSDVLPGLTSQLIGPGVQLSCLALFGIPALLRKLLPRWNALPLLAGAGYPLVSLLTRAVAVDRQEPPGDLINMGQLIILFSSIALILLGYVLQGDAVREWPDPSGANSSGS